MILKKMVQVLSFTLYFLTYPFYYKLFLLIKPFFIARFLLLCFFILIYFWAIRYGVPELWRPMLEMRFAFKIT